MKKIIIFYFIIFAIFSCKKIEKSVTIQFFHYKQNYINEINQIVSIFHKKNPNIFIEIESLPFDIKTVLKSRFESGDSPDLMMLSSDQMVYEYAKSGYLLDLTKERSTGRLYNSIKSDVSYNNKIYAFPLNMTGIGVFYNKNIFEKNNLELPDTFLKLKNTCEILNKEKITPFSISGKGDINFAYLFSLAHTVSLNLSNVDYKEWINNMNQSKESFNNQKLDALLKVLEFYKNNGNSIENKYDLNKQLQDFNSEKFAMIFNDMSISYKIKLDAGFIALPLTDKSEDNKIFCEPEASLVISSKSMPEKIDAAKKLLDFLSSDAVIKMWITNCKFTPAVKNADISSLDRPYQNLYRYIQDNKTIPYIFNLYPKTVFEKTKIETISFLEKKKNYPDIIKSLDDEWKKINDAEKK